MHKRDRDTHKTFEETYETFHETNIQCKIEPDKRVTEHATDGQAQRANDVQQTLEIDRPDEVDCSELVPENDKEVRRLKREICRSHLGVNDRLSTHEYAGDFALRYYLSCLFRSKLVRNRQRRRQKRTDKERNR